MNENQLDIIDRNVLTEDEQSQLESEIDQIIASHRNNRQDINRMVFECTAVLTEAENSALNLSSKEFLRRLIGGITGSNSRLQNKINCSLHAAQYASQVTLQKLAEQNLMTFELIAAINNKLNSSLETINDQFKNQYLVMGKFFLRSRNALISLETRMANLERNVKLLTWQNSIEYLDFNGTEYASLDDTEKIVCLVRDFYDITEGKWSTSDLLLLKTAMAQITLSPHQKVNYFSTMEQIADTPELMEKLLGGKEICPIEDPSYLISMGTLRKMEDLSGEEKYNVNSISRLLAKHGVIEPNSAIRNDLVQSYMAQKADVNLDNEIESFDLILELLYNLDQANGEHLLTIPKENLSELFLREHTEDAFRTIKESADLGDGRALYMMGQYYYGGYGLVPIDKDKSAQYFADSYAAGFSPAGYETAAFFPESSAEQANIPERVRTEIIAMAQSGNLPSENVLGLMYEYGTGVEKSDKEAFNWTYKAAVRGFAPAQCRLGIMYQNGIGTKRSDKEALKWYRKAAAQGYANAQCCLGLMYQNGIGAEKSDEEAFKWYHKAAEQGYADAQFHLGVMYKTGRGVEQSNEETIDWFLKAANQGLAQAQCYLGYMYEHGTGTVQSDEKAVEWFLKAANQGYADAQCRLGLMYQSGNGIEKSDEESFKWYRKAAEQGISQAQYRLGMMYQNGNGTEKSDEEAFKWFCRAAEQSNMRAQFRLGMMYDNGQGVEQSHKEAFKWFRKAAEQGLAQAQFNLSEMYKNGQGVKKSDEESLRWTRKAAEQGFAPAQCRFGYMYENGIGVEKCAEEAVKWFRKAAEQENAPAQFNLGIMYKNGKGTKQSPEEALKWFCRAAEQGFAPAQFYLGYMYENGIGTEKSIEEAAKWFLKAAEQGDASAQCSLGMMYYQKTGSLTLLCSIFSSQDDDPDLKKALEWFLKAANQNNAQAQYYLGEMYRLGLGVKESQEKAADWYRKAAEQGFAQAQYQLGELYNSGWGVEKSDEKAADWYRKAAEQGHKDAQKALLKFEK